MSEVVGIRFNDKDFKVLEEKARKADCSPGIYIRQVIQEHELGGMERYFKVSRKPELIATLLDKLQDINKRITSVENKLDDLPSEIVQEVRSNQM